MKSVLLLTVLIGLSQAINLDIPHYVCSLMVDGTLIKDPSPDCTDKYYECINGVAVEGTCPKNYLFNKDRQMCVPKAELYCPKFSACNGETKGFKPDPYSCGGFYVCDRKKETLDKCTNDMSFLNDRCAHSDECEINFCLIVPHYTYFGVEDGDCTGWQFCKGDELEVGSCDSGLIFDRSDGSCSYSEEGNCRTSTAHRDPKPGDYCDFDDFHIVPTSCTGYLYCHYNKVLRGDCMQGKYFNGAACVSRSTYACDRSDNACEGASGLSWNWVNDPKDCRRYYYCNGDKASSLQSCPDKKYFDQERQMCSATKPSYNACVE